MTTNRFLNVEYVRPVNTTDPIKTVKVKNPDGYLDLIVNKNKNGKAIRINSRDGMSRVNIGLDRVDALIEALKTVKTRGVTVSVEEIAFTA